MCIQHLSSESTNKPAVPLICTEYKYRVGFLMHARMLTATNLSHFVLFVWEDNKKKKRKANSTACGYCASLLLFGQHIALSVQIQTPPRHQKTLQSSGGRLTGDPAVLHLCCRHQKLTTPPFNTQTRFRESSFLAPLRKNIRVRETWMH